MRALLCTEYGPPDRLALAEVPDPVPAEGEAVVEVHAAAVNFPDCLTIENKYQIPIPLPFSPGSEFAGVVSSLGPGVSNLRVGERVFGTTFVGAFAEQIAVPAAGLRPIPEGVDFAVAGSFLVVSCTAYGALTYSARIEPAETLVVLGAAGGVGLAAVQLGAHLGARVIAAASSVEKLEACRAAGAVDGIDYSAVDLKSAIKSLTGGRGADVVIDPVGGALSEAALRATAWNGRFVVVGFASGEIPRVPLNLPLLKGSQIHAFNMGPLTLNEPKAMERIQAEVLQLLATKRIRPRICSSYPLSDGIEALRMVGERRAIGKVVIEPRR
jgi:NADPH2:quinone reductase